MVAALCSSLLCTLLLSCSTLCSSPPHLLALLRCRCLFCAGGKPANTRSHPLTPAAQVAFVKRGEAAAADVPEGAPVPGFSPAEAAPVAAEFSQKWQGMVEAINRCAATPRCTVPREERTGSRRDGARVLAPVCRSPAAAHPPHPHPHLTAAPQRGGQGLWLQRSGACGAAGRLHPAAAALQSLPGAVQAPGGHGRG